MNRKQIEGLIWIFELSCVKTNAEKDKKEKKKEKFTDARPELKKLYLSA